MMRDNEAMPAREAMRDNRGAIAGGLMPESREIVVKGNTLSSVFYGKIEGVPYHDSLPITQETPSAGNARGLSNDSRRISPMSRCNECTYCTTDLSNRIPSKHDFERAVCVSEVL